MLRVKEAFELERHRAERRYEWTNPQTWLWGNEPPRASKRLGAVRFCNSDRRTARAVVDSLMIDNLDPETAADILW